MRRVLKRITRAEMLERMGSRPTPTLHTPTPSAPPAVPSVRLRTRPQPGSTPSSKSSPPRPDAQTAPTTSSAVKPQPELATGPAAEAEVGAQPVGYCNPPPWGQFKKGQSGNPKGRKKGKKNVSTIINEEMETKVQVTEDGRRRSYTKAEVIIKTVVNKAAKGDYRAITLLFKLFERLNPSAFEALVPPSDGVSQPAERKSRMKALVLEYFGKSPARTDPSKPASVEPHTKKAPSRGDQDHE